MYNLDEMAAALREAYPQAYVEAWEDSWDEWVELSFETPEAAHAAALEITVPEGGRITKCWRLVRVILPAVEAKNG